MNEEKCSICRDYFTTSELYEKRGIIMCEDCFDKTEPLRINDSGNIPQNTGASTISDLKRTSRAINHRI